MHREMGGSLTPSNPERVVLMIAERAQTDSTMPGAHTSTRGGIHAVLPGMFTCFHRRQTSSGDD